MSEKIINNVVTKNDLKNTLVKLGVKKTDACLVHTALSKFQYMPGGPETLVKTLEETLENGTLMMPSEVSTNCDPATWEYPPLRQDLIQVVRDSMPPYDPKVSMTEGLGITPEYFRTLPGVVRSRHPYLPIAIWGKNAQKIVQMQPLNLPYGLGSPLDYLYQHHGKTIFFGTDYETCTMLHYAESTIGRKTETWAAATGIGDNGKTIWTHYQNVDMDSYDDFNDLGTAFEKQFPDEIQTSKLANGLVKVINVVPLIDFARQWFRQKDQKLNK